VSTLTARIGRCQVNAPTMTRQEWRTEFGRRLRAARKARGLSLNDVETKSGRRWLACVIGSYERGDRSPSVEKLHDYSAWLGVPLITLIPDLHPLWGPALEGVR
jgi:transcriptional regulator with XRE-family HTH domain